MGGLNFSMTSLNAFASTDQGSTWVWRGTVANAKDYPESSTGPVTHTLTWFRVPYVLHGVKYIDLVSLAPSAGDRVKPTSLRLRMGRR